MAKTDKLLLEDAEILGGRFRNFRGEAGRFNAEGDRSFCVIVPNELVPTLVDEGWNIKPLKGDEERVVNHIRRHPKIGNDCILGSKATVIGPITIGDDVTIGACAIVTKDVPSHSVVKGLNQIRPKRLEEIPEKYHASLGQYNEKI